MEHLEILLQIRFVPGDENDFQVPPCDLPGQHFYFYLFYFFFFFLFPLPFSPFFLFLPTPQILLAKCGAICKRLSWKEYVGKKKHIEISPKKG